MTQSYSLIRLVLDPHLQGKHLWSEPSPKASPVTNRGSCKSGKGFETIWKRCCVVLTWLRSEKQRACNPNQQLLRTGLSTSPAPLLPVCLPVLHQLLSAHQSHCSLFDCSLLQHHCVTGHCVFLIEQHRHEFPPAVTPQIPPLSHLISSI